MKLEFVDEALAILGRQRLSASSDAPAAARAPLPCFDCKKLMEYDEIPLQATHTCSCGHRKPLCSDHSLAHHHKGHITTALNPLADLVDDHCLKHVKEVATLFCVDDRARICPECVPDHSGHSLVSTQAGLSLLLPDLTRVGGALKAGNLDITSCVDAITRARDEVLGNASRSESAANASFDALRAAIDAHRASTIVALHKARDERVNALNSELDMLRNTYSQLVDGGALVDFASDASNLTLLLLSLKSVSVLSRISARKVASLGESVLSLDVDTSAVLDALHRCSALRQVRLCILMDLETVLMKQ